MWADSSEIEDNPTNAITSLYRQIFKTQTKISGSIVMGFDKESIFSELLHNIEFHPYSISLADKLSIMVFSLSVSKKKGWMGSGEGYMASFIHVFRKERCTIVQKFVKNKSVVEIWNNIIKISQYEGNSPVNVWQKVGILEKYRGTQLFGLEHTYTQSVLQQSHISKCQPSQWNNEELMNHLYEYHLKRQTIVEINWLQLFKQWESNGYIIEINTTLSNFLSVSKKKGWMGSGEGYMASFIHVFRKERCTIVQKFVKNKSVVEIWNNIIKISQYEGNSPVNVWQKVGILEKYRGTQLFGLEHTYTQSVLQQSHISKCQPSQWNNEELMNHLYEYHLKRQTIVEINWLQLFKQWESNGYIIEINTTLSNLYPKKYQFNDREMQAWSSMLKVTGCTNVTPFNSNISPYKFWTRFLDPMNDKKILKDLFQLGFLNPYPSNIQNPSQIFWNCFARSLVQNQKGPDGIRRILSIIAHQFSYRELQDKFGVSPTTINAAKKYTTLNGPGCRQINKPIIIRNPPFTKEIENQFEAFFLDKANVSMSSYKVDPRTNRPILYLLDQKESLWKRFSEIYSNGMKRTAFMARIEDGPYNNKYREDLGGLCSICAEYGYKVFDNLAKIIRLHIENLPVQVSPTTINAAKKYTTLNGPGCRQINKPIIIRNPPFTKEIENQFEAFFLDKANVSMSSYKVDPRTNRPILYLLDQKESLWKRFSEIYSNGMKRTAFMARIEDGPYNNKYREDLGGLCSICAEYGYKVFDNLAKIIRLHIENLPVQNKLLQDVELIKRHMKREYVCKISVGNNGHIEHNECIDHCLLYAFESILSTEEKQLLNDKKEKLFYYYAHQTRKVFLNEQVQANLLELDSDGAVLIIDYKMRILPKSA
ncbi:hypothetical protein Glove_341g69 [Diversispora epigaea]|uniref:Uncharacterized protein n=1 Tax=Diversispora epigaea TaxID=1348612 RepID=A0A397HH53_9GLOM|nr:hypothetical protein Glove_341g69 [Diversispora epigaea]